MFVGTGLHKISGCDVMEKAHCKRLQDEKNFVIRVPFRYVAKATVSLPLAGFIFCMLWAFLTDFEAATSTHCGVMSDFDLYIFAHCLCL